MIITQLAGGLGNQMFHYATARGYRRNEDEKIIFDTHLLQDLEPDIEKIIQRPYALSIFKNIKADKATESFHRLLFDQSLVNRLKRKIFNFFTECITQEVMKPILLPKVKSRNVFLIGNFQSEEYFKHIRSELIEEFEFPELDAVNEILKKDILNTANSLSLHIRRGDYLSSSNKEIFTSVNLSYYENALSILKKQLGSERIKTFLFTDDIDWVKSNFKSESLDITFIDGNDGENSWKDMYLMTCCKHHIISNSSFSWWGAWLSNKNGINIAPKYWYRPQTYYFDITHIVPRSWITVDYKL